MFGMWNNLILLFIMSGDRKFAGSIILIIIKRTVWFYARCKYRSVISELALVKSCRLPIARLS